MTFTGELAAIGTAMAFAATSTIFTLSGREIGSAVVNRTRLLMACCIILVIHYIAFGQFLPIDADGASWRWLALSGLIGLALGDACLFQAFVMIGARLSMLIMALAPILSTIMAWIFMGERLNAQQLAGIALTVGGIIWVVAEKKNNGQATKSPLGIGLLFAFGGAIGQAAGLVTAKSGLADGLPTFSGLLIRMLAATITIWVFTVSRGQTSAGFYKIAQNPRVVWLLLAGVIIGPVGGVWLSLVAVDNAPLGVASTLMALTPIFLLPIAYIVFHERFGHQTIAGTAVAFMGTALLFL